MAQLIENVSAHYIIYDYLEAPYTAEFLFTGITHSGSANILAEIALTAFIQTPSPFAPQVLAGFTQFVQDGQVEPHNLPDNQFNPPVPVLVENNVSQVFAIVDPTGVRVHCRVIVWILGIEIPEPEEPHPGGWILESAGYALVYDARSGSVLRIHEKLVAMARNSDELPGAITDEEARRIRAEVEAKFPGRPIDVLVVRGDARLKAGVPIVIDVATRTIQERPEKPSSIWRRLLGKLRKRLRK